MNRTSFAFPPVWSIKNMGAARPHRGYYVVHTHQSCGEKTAKVKVGEVRGSQPCPSFRGGVHGPPRSPAGTPEFSLPDGASFSVVVVGRLIKSASNISWYGSLLI